MNLTLFSIINKYNKSIIFYKIILKNMARPCKPRNIENEIQFTCFKPAWIPRTKISKIELKADELEALRLFNLEWLSQEEASKKIQISPSTFNRLLKSANKKITDALVNWKWIKIYKTDWTHNCI